MENQVPANNSSVSFPFTLTQLVENMENQTPLTQLVEKIESQASLPVCHHESWEGIQNECETTISLPTLAGENQIKPLPALPHRQYRKGSTSAWLALALSGLVLIMGTMVTHIFPLPFHSLVPTKHIQARPSAKIATHTMDVIVSTIPIPHTPQPTPLPTADISPSVVLQPIQAFLSGSYVEQTSEVYNLTTEGTLDWVHWGLRTPTDVDRKSGVQPQISSFSLIRSGTVQRDGYYSNAYIWSDGTPVARVGQVPSGVYVTGVNNGFAIRVAASSTPRTLRVYIADNLAHGQLTASLDGKIYTDASLNMLHDPYNIEDNGIYTLVFSANAPNQTLTVAYTALQTNGSKGYVMLQSATLQ